MRIGSLLLIVWLVIGAIGAGWAIPGRRARR
jgi:hypothetical protein